MVHTGGVCCIRLDPSLPGRAPVPRFSALRSPTACRSMHLFVCLDGCGCSGGCHHCWTGCCHTTLHPCPGKEGTPFPLHATAPPFLRLPPSLSCLLPHARSDRSPSSTQVRTRASFPSDWTFRFLSIGSLTPFRTERTTVWRGPRRRTLRRHRRDVFRIFCAHVGRQTSRRTVLRGKEPCVLHVASPTRRYAIPVDDAGRIRRTTDGPRRGGRVERRADDERNDAQRCSWEETAPSEQDVSAQAVRVPCRCDALGRENWPTSWQKNQDSPKKTLHWR